MTTTATQRRPRRDRAATGAWMFAEGWSVTTPPREEGQNTTSKLVQKDG